jgi:hypothetical protein
MDPDRSSPTMKSLVKLRTVLCACVASLVLGGCTFSRQFIPLPDHSSPPGNGRARIYAIHHKGSGRFAVADGNRLIGEACAGCYVGWEREPGMATIITGGLVRLERGANPFASIQDTSVSYNFDGKPHTFLTPVSKNVKVEAGKTSYVLLGFSWSQNSLTVDVLDEPTGSALLKTCKTPTVETDRVK